MEIMDRDMKESPPDQGQQRIAQIPVEPGHRRRLNAPGKTIADNQVMALAKQRRHGLQGGKIITAVCIPHNDPRIPGCLNPRADGTPITFSGFMNHPYIHAAGQRGRLVLTAVVHDNDFAGRLMGLQELLCLLQAMSQGSCFIEARHHNRKFKLSHEVKYNDPTRPSLGNLLEIIELGIGREHEQGFIHQANGLLHIPLMQHFYGCMHVPQWNGNEHGRTAIVGIGK